MNTEPAFSLDTSTGNTDLAWNLVLLFFVTTFIALRPAAGLVGDAAMDGAAAKDPVVLGLAAMGSPEAVLAGLQVRHPGRLGVAPVPSDAVDWLAQGCAESATAVQVDCPVRATHADCRSALGALMRAVPDCHYQY